MASVPAGPLRITSKESVPPCDGRVRAAAVPSALASRGPPSKRGLTRSHPAGPTTPVGEPGEEPPMPLPAAGRRATWCPFIRGQRSGAAAGGCRARTWAPTRWAPATGRCPGGRAGVGGDLRLREGNDMRTIHGTPSPWLRERDSCMYLGRAGRATAWKGRAGLDV